jgi:hypothetical protein
MSLPQKLGADPRAAILPTVEPAGVGFLGPNYDYSDQLITPAQIGVKREGSFAAVKNGLAGVQYYVDTIIAGESSGPLTKGKRFQHYGTNYFLKTGLTCSNGADMWQYMELIPKGDAFGKNFSKAMAELKMPALRGLAPGIIEDTKSALDPSPVLKAILGSGNPQCKLVTKPVGDELGRIQDSDGNMWVDDKASVFYQGGKAYQTKWILDKMVDKATYDADAKTMNPDGTPAVQQVPVKETFRDFGSDQWLLFILGLLAVGNIWAFQRR